MNLVETNLLAARIMAEQEVNVDEVIRELIDTSWGGSNDSQAKAMELLKGLAFSDDPKSNKFMAALDKFTSGLDAEQFTESYQGKKKILDEAKKDRDTMEAASEIIKILDLPLKVTSKKRQKGAETWYWDMGEYQVWLTTYFGDNSVVHYKDATGGGLRIEAYGKEKKLQNKLLKIPKIMEYERSALTKEKAIQYVIDRAKKIKKVIKSSIKQEAVFDKYLNSPILKETSEKKISKDNLIKLFPAGTSEFRMIMNMEKGDSGVHKAKKDGKNYEVFYRGGDNYLIRKV